MKGPLLYFRVNLGSISSGGGGGRKKCEEDFGCRFCYSHAGNAEEDYRQLLWHPSFAFHETVTHLIMRYVPVQTGVRGAAAVNPGIR